MIEIGAPVVIDGNIFPDRTDQVISAAKIADARALRLD
jgi:hypothetical protein